MWLKKGAGLLNKRLGVQCIWHLKLGSHFTSWIYIFISVSQNTEFIHDTNPNGWIPLQEPEWAGKTKITDIILNGNIDTNRHPNGLRCEPGTGKS